MGLRCSCGVRSNPITTSTNLEFFFIDVGVRAGTLTLTINACADTPETIL